MKMLFRMTKMSFVLTMLLYLILASFTNLNASTTQTILENENVNLNLQADKITPIDAYFIKDGIKSTKDPDGMYISTIINKEGESLNNLKITLSLKSQIIDNLEITYTKSENDLDTNLKTPKYSLDFAETYDLYTISFSEEVSQPLRVTIKTKLLIDSIFDSATSSQYSITNIIDISASEYNPSLSYVSSNIFEGLNYLDLELVSDNTSTFKFNLNYRSMDNTKENTIIIHYDNNLQLIKNSFKELNDNNDFTVETESENQLKITTKASNLNLTYDLKFKANTTINTNTNLYSSTSLNGGNLTSAVNFNYNPIIIENSESIYYKDKNSLETAFVVKSDNSIKDFKVQIKNNNLDFIPKLDKVIVKDLNTNKPYIQGSDFTYDKVSKTINFESSLINPKIKVRYLVSSSKKSLQPSIDFYIYAKVDKEVKVVKHLNIEVVNSNNILDIKNSVMGSYEAKSKVITWEILTNFQDNLNENNQIETSLSPKEKYMKDSLQIIQYNQLVDGSLSYIKHLNPDEYVVVYNNESNNLKLSIKNTEQAVYKLILKTSLADEEIDYQVDHLSRIYINGEIKEIKTTITIPYVNLHINKLGKQNQNIVDWTILINEKQSTLDKVEVIDKLCNKQTYLKDTLRVFKTTVNSDGSYVIHKTPLDKDNYVINYFENESEGFILSLVNMPINVPYIITYKTQPKLNLPIRLVSSAILNNLEKAVEVVDYLPQDIDLEPTLPSLPQRDLASYSIYKITAGNLPLADVVFKLEHITSNNIYTAITNENGLASFENLAYGNYILKEVATIPGYKIEEKLLKGVKITIDKKVSFDTFINKPATLTIKSLSEDLSSLSGGVFTLSLKVDNDYVKVKENFTINNEIQFKALLPGKYRLCQISPVPFFIHNLEPVDFEIKLNEDTSVEFINYKGKALVYDKYQKEFLTGGIFKIIDLNNNIIDLFTLSQTSYQIDNLAPMTYKLQSISSAVGYFHLDKSIDFNIDKSSYGKPKPILIYVSSEKKSKLEEVIQPVNTGIVNNKFMYQSLIMACLVAISQLRRKN